MPVVNGVWQPDVFDKQLDLMRLCRVKDGLNKYIMVSGPRWTGKTIGCLNAVVDHAWNTQRAAVSVLCTSITAGADQGVWTLLTESIIPQWIEGDFGLEWAEKGSPRQHGVTKKFYCIIKNKWGGTSRIQLDSLKDEREVEADFKNRYLTMIYWSEVSNFNDPNTYRTLTQALRGVGIPKDEFLLLGDTNPAPNGTDSWIYKEWYEFRTADPSKLKEDERPRQKYLKLVEWFPDDNPHLSEDFKLQKRSEFSADPDLFARYWLGQWKKSTTGALFIGQFKRSIHVIENEEFDGEIYVGVPEPDTDEIELGWDIGESNHAVEFAARYFRDDGASVFRFFDEVVILGGIVSVAEITELVVAKMRKWETFLGRQVEWTHWSDRSSLDQRQSISTRYPAEEVFDASQGEIKLIGVDNTRGSVAPSVRQWRRMLFQQRLEFSEYGCPKLIEVNTALKPKPLPKSVVSDMPTGWMPDTIAEQSQHKHPFDAGRYIIMGRCWEEIIASILKRATGAKTTPDLVSVPL